MYALKILFEPARKVPIISVTHSVPTGQKMRWNERVEIDALRKKAERLLQAGDKATLARTR